MRFETKSCQPRTGRPHGRRQVLTRSKERTEIVRKDFRQNGRWRTVIRLSVFVLSIWCASGPGAYAQESQALVVPSHVPVIDAGIGPCSVEFTVTDAAGAAVYNAKIRVHVAYGFLSLRKIDLEIGTNSEGKARFDGLPNKGKTLLFRAAQGNRQESLLYQPTQMCTEHALLVLKD